MNTLRIIIRTLVITIITLFGLRIFTILLQRVPGVFVSLSILSLAILIIAFIRGNFRAVGLKNRRAILWAIGASFILFIVSGTIFLFVDR